MGLALCGACSGCSRRDAMQSERTGRLKEFADKRAARTSALRGMSGSELIAELGRESARGVEPFNSTTYREAVQRGKVLIPDLMTSVGIADSTRLLPLL